MENQSFLEVFGRAPVTCFSIFLAKWTLPSCREDDAHPISSKVRSAIRRAQPVIESADDVNSISTHTSVALAKNRTDKNITALFKACQMNSGEREKRASTSDKRDKKQKKLLEAHLQSQDTDPNHRCFQIKIDPCIDIGPILAPFQDRFPSFNSSRSS